MKRKSKQTEQNKQSLGTILKNNLYMLSIIIKVSPKTILWRVSFILLGGVINFATSTLLLRQIINNFQLGETIARTGFLIIVMYTVRFLYWTLVDIINLRVFPIESLNLQQHIEEMIYDKLDTLELGCYENTDFYDSYVKVATDAVSRVDAVANSALGVLDFFLNMSLHSVLILTIDPVLIIFAVIPMFTTFFFSRWDNKYMFDYHMEMAVLERKKDYSRRTFYLSDYAKEMRLTRINKLMIERFHQGIDLIDRLMKNKLPLHAFINLMMGIIEWYLCEYGAIFYAAYRTLVSGTMMYGDCIVVMGSISNLTYYLSDASKKLTEFQAHSLYVENFRKFLAYKPKIRDGILNPPDTCALLEMKDVHFRYDGQEEDTIRGVTISLRPGERIALVGHNGAGKTTLAKLMLRLYDPTEGTVEYGDQNIKKYRLLGKGGYRDQFAVVFQDFKLFAMTVAENILLREVKDAENEAVCQAMNNSGIAEKVATLPQAEGTLLTREFDETGAVLSGGEGQKIAIARAFAKESQIVILDEPSSALDPIAEYKMYENMLKASENTSVVFISHRLSSAVLADTIYLLENGQVIEQGSHSELIQAGGKYAEMFRIQAENYLTEPTEENA